MWLARGLRPVIESRRVTTGTSAATQSARTAKRESDRFPETRRDGGQAKAANRGPAIVTRELGLGAARERRNFDGSNAAEGCAPDR